MIRLNSSLLISFVCLVSACSGTNGTETTSLVGGGPTAGGNFGNAGVTATGGATSNQAGSSAVLGGFSGLGGTSPSGGGLAIGGSKTTGGSIATGGTQASTGGSQGSTGGAPISTGGKSNGTGGTKNATGGTPSNTGGIQNSSGGTQNTTGGTRTSTGGTVSTTGGTRTSTGGTQNTAGSAASLHSSGTYATAGAWHGYIWPAIESGSAYDANNHTTITPTAAQGFPSGGPPFCISGHVPATPNSLAVAMVGMNTNQSQSGGATAAQWTTTGTGILVNVSNPGVSPLRLQIQTNETGAIATLWCAMITVFDQDVIIPWSQFNTQCFNNNKGTYFDQSVGISTVMVLVPGTSQSGGYDFDFCVNDMAPA